MNRQGLLVPRLEEGHQDGPLALYRPTSRPEWTASIFSALGLIFSALTISWPSCSPSSLAWSLRPSPLAGRPVPIRSVIVQICESNVTPVQRQTNTVLFGTLRQVFPAAARYAGWRSSSKSSRRSIELGSASDSSTSACEYAGRYCCTTARPVTFLPWKRVTSISNW